MTPYIIIASSFTTQMIITEEWMTPFLRIIKNTSMVWLARNPEPPLFTPETYIRIIVNAEVAILFYLSIRFLLCLQWHPSISVWRHHFAMKKSRERHCFPQLCGNGGQIRNSCTSYKRFGWNKILDGTTSFTYSSASITSTRHYQHQAAKYVDLIHPHNTWYSFTTSHRRFWFATAFIV